MQLEFTSDLSAWQNAFAEGVRGIDTLDVANEEIGDNIVDEVRNNFEAGGGIAAWKPLAPSTIERKRREDYPTAPLIRTGDLYRSIRKLEVTHDHVDIGTDLEYGRYVFFGTYMIPARSPFVFAPIVLERQGAIYLNHIWARRLH
jgi:phage gpG-like protein